MFFSLAGLLALQRHNRRVTLVEKLIEVDEQCLQENVIFSLRRKR